MKPQNAKELFNLRYASLRNVVERIFGVAKRKFKILGVGTEYSVDTQVHLVLGLLGLYNFISLHEGESIEDIKNEDQEIDNEIEDNKVEEPFVHGSMASIINKRRDKLAKSM